MRFDCQLPISLPVFGTVCFHQHAAHPDDRSGGTADGKLVQTTGRALMQRTRALLRDTEGAQLVEFAFTLPLLIVVAVGIFDFGSAFTLKEKLVGVAQMGARVGANQPSTDLT